MCDYINLVLKYNLIFQSFRSNWNSLDLLNRITEIVDPSQPTLISGDFNICSMENSSNRLVQGLLNMKFNQLVHEPSHINGRYIDHAYLNNNTLDAKIYRYSPYYSDHDGICITLTKKESCSSKLESGLSKKK